MTAADAFLADIVADPADDGVRLIFADWLEDNGEPERAEFIRKQVRRQKAVIKSRQFRRWFGPWWGNMGVTMSFGQEGIIARPYNCGAQGGGGGQTNDDTKPHIHVTRGFISRVGLRLDQWIKYGPALVRTHPLETVTLCDRKPREGHTSSSFGWYGRNIQTDPDDLPYCLYDLLRGHGDIDDYWKWYPDIPWAEDALSIACLEWARSVEPEEGGPDRPKND